MKPHLAALLRVEIGMLLRARFSWLLFAVLLAALTAGAVNGQRHVDQQRQVLDRLARHQADTIAADHAALARYRASAGPLLPYWQDPGDVAGYMRYGLNAYAAKPPLALGALAVGHSTLLPYYLRSELDFVAPPASDFDFVAPRTLALGAFDLAFVLAGVLPLVLIALGAARLSTERDSGVLALMAAQLTSYRGIVLVKAAALAAVSLPAIMGACALALLVAGVPCWDRATLPAIALAAAALAGFTLAWIGLIALVASRTGMLASCLRLVALWMGLTFIVPAAGALAIGLAWPPPAALEQLDALRRASNVSGPERDALFRAYLEQHPKYAAAAKRLGQIPYATKIIAVQTNLERHARARAHAARRQLEAAEQWARLLRYLSPPMMFEDMLTRTAGTDGARHQRFLRDAQAYTDTLRRFFWERALEQAARPAAGCANCASRLNFTGHASIPRFAASPPHDGVARPVIEAVVYLWLAALLAAVLLWKTAPLRL